MRQLVYISDEAAGFSATDLKKILDTSRLNNRQSSVTGLLLVDGGQFLQALEGEREDVAATFERINADPRHHSVSILGDREVPAREFGNWAMAANDGEEPFGGRVAKLIYNVTCPTIKAKFRNFADYV